MPKSHPKNQKQNLSLKTFQCIDNYASSTHSKSKEEKTSAFMLGVPCLMYACAKMELPFVTFDLNLFRIKSTNGKSQNDMEIGSTKQKMGNFTIFFSSLVLLCTFYAAHHREENHCKVQTMNFPALNQKKKSFSEQKKNGVTRMRR